MKKRSSILRHHH